MHFGQKRIKWPVLFQRFKEDGFGKMEGTKMLWNIGENNLIVFDEP